jgi:uncharacterized protein
MNASHPPYEQLIALLLRPFLSEPAVMKVDCEYMPTHARVWVRISFADTDREKVAGEGNRHLYATKAVLSAVAREAGQTVHLELYDANAGARRPPSDRPQRSPSKIGRPTRRAEPNT